MEKRTVLDRIDVMQSGVNLRFGKQIIDGEEVAANDWHRVVIELEDDADARLADVSAHLQVLGYPAIAAGDIIRIKKFLDLAKEQA